MAIESVVGLLGPFLIPVALFTLGAVGYALLLRWNRLTRG